MPRCIGSRAVQKKTRNALQSGPIFFQYYHVVGTPYKHVKLVYLETYCSDQFFMIFLPVRCDGRHMAPMTIKGLNYLCFKRYGKVNTDRRSSISVVHYTGICSL